MIKDDKIIPKNLAEFIKKKKKRKFVLNLWRIWGKLGGVVARNATARTLFCMSLRQVTPTNSSLRADEIGVAIYKITMDCHEFARLRFANSRNDGSARF